MVKPEVKYKKRFYNPFPREPSNIGFLKGKLVYGEKALPTKTFAAGECFLINWHAEGGGYLSVNHKEEPQRVLWSTIHGHAFISGALGNAVVQESRGSFSIHEKAELDLSHQTIEQIQLVWPENCAQINDQAKSTYILEVQNQANTFFHEASCALEDGDGHKVNVQGPAVIITGCLYNDPKIAACQLKHYLVSQNADLGPFYDINRSKFTQIGVRYWLFFGEKRNHHLGFSLKLEQLVKQAPDLHSLAIFHPQLCQHSQLQVTTKQGQYTDCTLENLDQMLWLWSRRPLSAFKYRGSSYTFTKLIQPTATLKRLMVNDMFTAKRTIPIDFEEELKSNSLQLTNGDYELIKPTDMGYNSKSMGQRLDCKLNMVILTYATDEDERFFGFGEQFSYFDLKGRRVPIMVQEQGLGRGDQPITAAVNLVAERSGGDWHTTYAPVPYYITSKSRCIFLEEYNYSVFDLTKSKAVQIQLHGESMHGRIVHGQTPLQLIERYSEAIGRMRELPDWVMDGAIVGMQGGTQAVRRVWRELKAADVPISAFWLQDWVGQRKTSIGWQLWWNWEVDEEHYSGWNELVKDLRDQGINTMAYLNPFLASVDEKPKKSRDLFEEAKRQGYLVQSPGCQSPYMIPNTSFEAAMVDLTNQEACKWLKGVMHGMIRTGVKGWMADFGESLPFDARLGSGEDPREAHNKYPEMWAKLNREVVEECGDDELVFFMRAAYMRSPKWATLFWEGDQMVSWQRHDGIKSAVVGLLSGGLSGFAFNHSDIGGYCTVDMPFLRYHRSEELLLRWMELNAFSTIFRTHEGNIPSVNHQFNTTSGSLRHFARFAKVYKAWAFYRKQLVKVDHHHLLSFKELSWSLDHYVQEAATTGLPVVRHMFLHYPHDPHTMAISYEQFLVGTEILVVPVVDKSREHVWAYFPAGPHEWQHVWTGNIYLSSNQGSKVRVSSPLGYPAVFVKTKSQIGQRFIDNLASLHLLPTTNHQDPSQ